MNIIKIFERGETIVLWNSVKLVHTFKLLKEGKTIDHEISVSAAKEFTQLKNMNL